MATFLGSYTNGTVVQNATVPIFKIESFEWISDESQIPPKILEALQDPKSGYLNFTEEETQMTVAIGATTLLKDQPWKAPTTDALPEAIEVLHEVQYAAIYVFSGGNQEEYDCHKSIDYINNTEFGSFPPEIHLVKSRRRDQSDCMAVAKLRISAEVTNCSQGGPESNSSSCFIASNIMISTSDEVLPDNLTREVFAMMQEVHTIVASLRMNDPETYMGQLEQALRESLVRTYQGTWSALTESFSLGAFPNGIGRLETRGWEPVQALRAEVSPVRILSWLAISVLLVLSGFLVLVLDSRSAGKTVTEPVIEAIMLDSSRVIKDDDAYLGNVVDVGKANGSIQKRLRLEYSSRPGVEGGNCCARLVPEGTPVM
ncbi:multidrug resistance-associated abc transporter [Colletotrichum asianum]|uniref:Multidrug resistance-associated abc transporter n=1 Tax=Colletotrichum asianum TaxID=702518 RepID=A0A8H3ZLP8_9PEZI|nr:multidrug resistance-associated abc transporter [Colletotrichum asianum]